MVRDGRVCVMAVCACVCVCVTRRSYERTGAFNEAAALDARSPCAHTRTNSHVEDFLVQRQELENRNS